MLCFLELINYSSAIPHQESKCTTYAYPISVIVEMNVQFSAIEKNVK